MGPPAMRLDDLDYELPPASISQAPAEPRDAARLLVVTDDTYRHHRVSELPELLDPGDVVVVNDTRVRPARLRGRRATGGAVEILVLGPIGADRWEALVRPGRKLRDGESVAVGSHRVEVGGVLPGGHRVVAAIGEPMEAVMADVGQVPLPPYIERPLADPERYQTIYARRAGSAAAPTAGLHFTPELHARLIDRGIRWAAVELEVSVATFRPIRHHDPRRHPMHGERIHVSERAVRTIDEARRAGGRVVAVGTTTVRALESAALGGTLRPHQGETGLFILPGHRFAVVDVLLTNFHAPRSTLLALLMAVMGPRWREAYATALGAGYRFLSLGDAMLVPVRRTQPPD